MNIVNYNSTVFDEDDFLEDIYDALTEGCIENIKEKNFDFYAGSMGIISVLENAYHRIPHLIKPKIEKIIESFEIEKVNISSFITEIDYEEDENGNPITVNCPHYNNGLAHGLPAIILTLSKLNKINPNKYLKSLIYDTILLIKKHKNPIIKDNEQMFLERIYLNKPNEYKARLAWCYSDLTLGWAFLNAGKNLDDNDLINLGNEVLEHTIIIENTNKLASNTRLICLCHGSAGNAFIYKRIYEETKDPKFEEAYKKWASFAFENYNNGEIHFEYKINKYITNHTIMDGLLGYGLFLLAEGFPESQAWNIFMLMN
jgi:lantibiotic modifying enzyme